MKRRTKRIRVLSISALMFAAVLWGTLAHLMRIGPFFGRHQATSDAVQGLPLEMIPVADKLRRSDLMAALLTGDGGWTAIDQQIATELAEHGIATVGWISPRYFWTRKTPDEAARDLSRVIEHFTKEWGVERVILIGYSRGAGVLPFMVNRLPNSVQAKVAEIALLGLGPEISFVIRWKLQASGGGDPSQSGRGWSVSTSIGLLASPPFQQ